MPTKNVQLACCMHVPRAFLELFCFWDKQNQECDVEIFHEIEAIILNRIIRWSEEGWQYEADQRHTELIVKLLGMEKRKSSGDA